MVKNPPANAGEARDAGLIPELGRSPENDNPLQYVLPRKFNGQRSLVGYSPEAHKELDMTEATKHTHVSKKE